MTATVSRIKAPPGITARSCEETIGSHGGHCKIRGVDVYMTGQSLQKVARTIGTWSKRGLKGAAPHGTLRIIDLSVNEFEEKFTESYLAGAKYHWEPGFIYLKGASGWVDYVDTAAAILDPLRREFDPVHVPERAFAGRGNPPLFFTPDISFYSREIVHQFISQGFVGEIPDYLRGELGLHETVSDRGKSIHQLRFRGTIPRLNKWIDNELVQPTLPTNPNLQFYTGFLTTVSTNPFGILSTASWGADAELATFNGYKVILDTTIQQRIRSSGPQRGDRVGLEWTPRLVSPNESWMLGLSTFYNIEGATRLAFVAKGEWR